MTGLEKMSLTSTLRKLNLWDDIIINLNFNNGGENDQNLIKKLGYINSESNIPAVKFLGIYIDNKLNFEYHIKYIQKKISNSLFVINRVKKLLNEIGV